MNDSMKTTRRRRGSILVMTIFFMVILFITASAFLVLIPVESRAALRSEQQTTSALVAEAGVTEALAWLRYQLAPPDDSGSKEPMASGVYPSEVHQTTEAPRSRCPLHCIPPNSTEPGLWGITGPTVGA